MVPPRKSRKALLYEAILTIRRRGTCESGCHCTNFPRACLFSGVNAGGQPPAPDGPSLQKDWRQYRRPNRKRQVPHRNSCQHAAHSHHHGLACGALADEPAVHRHRGGVRGREDPTETQINALVSLAADEMLVQRHICLNEEGPGNLDGCRALALSAKK